MTDKKDDALKLALEALEYISSHYMSLPKIGCMALAVVEEALAEPAQPSKPWVGLTPEDKAAIEKIVGITEDDDGWMVSQMFTLTEAKLREKNA